MQVATLQFETKLQKWIRMVITIFKIFIWDVYRPIYGRKSRFTSHRKAKFPTVYLRYITSQNKNFDYSYPLNDWKDILLSFIRESE